MNAAVNAHRAPMEVESAAVEVESARRRRARRAQTPAPLRPPALRRSRGALSTKARSEQRARRRPHLGVRHLEQAVDLARAGVARGVLRRETSLRASDLFEFGCRRPLSGKFSISSSQAPRKDFENATPAHAGSAGGAAPARRFAGRSSCSSGRPTRTSALARTAGDCEALAHAGGPARGIRLRRLDRRARAAARSAPAAATTSATCRRPPTNDEHVVTAALDLDLATPLPPARRRCSCRCSAISRASSCRRMRASTSPSARWRSAAGPRLPTPPDDAPDDLAGATRYRRGAARRRRRADRAVVALRAQRAPPPAARPAPRGGCGGRPGCRRLCGVHGDGGDLRAPAHVVTVVGAGRRTLHAARLPPSLTVGMPTWRAPAARRRRRRHSRL